MKFKNNIVVALAGAAACGVVAGLAQTGMLRKVAVKAMAEGLRVNDFVMAKTQSMVDEAQDVSAEARLQARIDAAVRERMGALEADIRKEVEAEFAHPEA